VGVSIGRLERRREMRTVKSKAFLSGLCGFAAALGMLAATANAQEPCPFGRCQVSTERGVSILAFPKVLASDNADTVIQIANTSNSMVHAQCFYVDAREVRGAPLWQVTDFHIWLTKKQPTQWQVGRGRFVNPNDDCFRNGQIKPEKCADAGIDPGFIPPVSKGFQGELKCVEVNHVGEPWGGNHLKGEATIIYDGGDVAKYNAVGFEGTERAGETGNQLLLDQPHDEFDSIGQYAACPDSLILNHLTEVSTDPVILNSGAGGVCERAESGAQEGNRGKDPCETDDDCSRGRVCVGGPLVEVATDRKVSLRSATLTDLTLVPCSQDFENLNPSQVTVQFEIYNEFEQLLSASTTVDCWRNFHLFEVTSPNHPERSQFSRGIVGTPYAQTKILPVPGEGAVIGVAGVTRADAMSRLTRTLTNLHMVGDRPGDEIVLPDRF
jgi:hypothetical protein